ncbi:MAG: hypothetical protein P4L53_09900 [Candidatus Obscuribacterales bacterium]|nr:hypothetical protein [Candidatus Obscuribacterales bacterium]
MANALSVRSIKEEDIADYMFDGATSAANSGVALPAFPNMPMRTADKQARRGNLRPVGSLSRPQLVPNLVPQPKGRQIPVVVRANRTLRTVLVALCGVAILGYGWDVASSNDVSKLQDQARRLNEQNSELSAQLLKAISYEGIQENVLGKFGLHTAEHVVIVKEVAPPKMPVFKASRHHLPVMAGF